MLQKPLIGLNADFRAAKNDSPAFSYVCAGYYDCIARAGGIPVIVPPLENEADIACLLDQLQGFVMVGGADLDPRRDGFMLHPSVRMLETRRETFDRTLMRLIAERRIPVFGIGVGMQLLNVTQGGNLFLHIPEDLPGAAAQGSPGSSPSARSGSRARFADGTGLRRRRNPCEQPASHGGGRSGRRVRYYGSLPGRRHRSHRKRAGGLVGVRDAIPSRRGVCISARSAHL